MSTESPTREGADRERTLDYYGRYCQECLWAPANDVQEHKLHVHITAPNASGGPNEMDNRTVLCRDCHLNAHSESEFSHEFVGRLTQTLADQLTHKQDGFVDRTARRVRLGTVFIVDGQPPSPLSNATQTTQYILVEGIIDGDHYDAYFVDPDQPYLAMCSCYQHKFGAHRARNICTHVGASIVRKAIEKARETGEDAAFTYIEEMGGKLNDQAADYIQTRELLKDEISTLDIEDRFSESYADRARRQAMKMTQYGREYKAYGGECEGCEVVLTADGYQCSHPDKANKFPCPAKLGAYLLDNSSQFQPDIEKGDLFKVYKAFTSDVDVGDVIAAVSLDEQAQTATFCHVTPDESEEFTVSFTDFVEAVLANSLNTETKDDLKTYYTGVTVSSDGVPRTIAPTVERSETLSITSADVHPDLTRGDLIHVLENDAQSREVRVEVVDEASPFGGREVVLPYADIVPALRERRIEKGRLGEHVDIIATDVVDEDGTWMVALTSPYESRDDFMALDKGETRRHWNPDISKWVLKVTEIEQAVEHLTENWRVFVPADVRDEIAEKTP